MKANIVTIFLFLIYHIRTDAIILTLTKLSFLANILSNSAPAIRESVPDIIHAHGYPVEVHRVVTSDGYVLEMHRIPLIRSKRDEIGQKVAFLPHCYLCSSASWIQLGPKKALAYLLSDNGYDVWMLNSRGTKYSLKHKNMSSKSRKFWNFSLQEVVSIDLKESIDYTLKTTNVSEVDYVGYSMGTTMLIALLSEYPEYNNKIRKAALLAPFTFVGHSAGAIPEMSPHSNLIEKILADMRIYDFPPRRFPLNEIMYSICQRSNFLLYQSMCSVIVEGFANNTSNNTDMNLLGYFFRHYPEPSSVRSLLHFYQMRNTGDFKKYDFGQYRNLIEYGTKEPPHYNISRTKVPISLFWSDADNLATEKDFHILRPQLRSVVEEFKLPVGNFKHGDYVWGKHVHELIYEKVLTFFSLNNIY